MTSKMKNLLMVMLVMFLATSLYHCGKKDGGKTEAPKASSQPKKEGAASTTESKPKQKKEAASLDGDIKIAGSSTVYPITVAMAEEFRKVKKDVKIAVSSTGTGGGFKNFFIPGKNPINNASRRIKKKEIAKCKENGFDVLELQVATDAITIVVNKDANWVSDITPDQLKKIWNKENPAKNWKDVDKSWPDKKMELYGPTSASGTYEFFNEAILGKKKHPRTDYQGTEQDNSIVTAVSSNKYALGYFGLAYYEENKKKLKALKVNGVEPNLETAKSGKYKPLSRPIYIYVNVKALKEQKSLQEFVKFYMERVSTKIISQVGYVPLTKEEQAKELKKLEDALK